MSSLDIALFQSLNSFANAFETSHPEFIDAGNAFFSTAGHPPELKTRYDEWILTQTAATGPAVTAYLSAVSRMAGMTEELNALLPPASEYPYSSIGGDEEPATGTASGVMPTVTTTTESKSAETEPSLKPAGTVVAPSGLPTGAASGLAARAAVVVVAVAGVIGGVVGML